MVKRNSKLDEGRSKRYRPPYSYRQNKHETFDDDDSLEMQNGFDLEGTYVKEDVGAMGGSLGGYAPEHAIAVTNSGRAQGSPEKVKRGVTHNEWDSAYNELNELNEKLNRILRGNF